MNPIKKLYQKLLGSSDDEVETEDEEAEAEETQGKEDELSDGESPCYLFFEVDDDGVVKMSCYWDGSEFSLVAFTELLYNLCTGQMTGNIFQFWESECDEENYEVFLAIVAEYTRLLEVGLKDIKNNGQEIDSPIVKPSDLSKKNINPFEIS